MPAVLTLSKLRPVLTVLSTDPFQVQKPPSLNTPYPLLKKLLKWLGYALLALLLLVVLLWAALQFPAVQQKIADKATDYLEERIQTPFDIDRIYIDFFN